MTRDHRRPNGLPPRRRGPWKRGPIPVVGLIGGIGAGKSLVAADLAARGALVLDADAIGHALLQQRPARDLVLHRFGDQVLDRSVAGYVPQIDRKALGALVFASPSALRDLEAILHPRMARTFAKAIDRASRRGQAKAVVIDAAILLEAGWDGLCDLVAFVDAPRDQRLARLNAQRGWSPETLELRERVQRPLDEKRARADLLIRNESGPDELGAEVDRLWDRLQSPPPRPRRLSRPAEPRTMRPPRRPRGGTRRPV